MAEGDRFGKYQVLERIGRGGMGTIFKAHDPVLDRPVALKVISDEVEVTDELRARFFREAQACARLSHPNIVTVYDMGEENGRLFIVMEMLDGEELRRLLAQRKVLALEDKLNIMMQVCDGLHFAHQNGIVHRDIKPGNIMVLRDGQVKILDFGIALIAAAEGDLTRTGLIMGTLRYLSPEQVRGRADHRSDIFSVGAVFYELLTFRPPFDGADPIQILDQLRSEDPPSLRELDPSLPSELVAIVERAMRKDPGERFPDLEQMRSDLEQVQRGLTEEAQRIRGRLRGQLEQVGELEAALAERVGSSQEDATEPVPDVRGGRLATLRALENELVGRLKAGQAKMAQAEALAPAVQRGLALLQGGQLAQAIAELEAVVAEMPEHRRALDGLAQARAQADAQRDRQLVVKLAEQARTALAEGRHAICLELLRQAAAIPAAAEIVPGLASLREAAEGVLAKQEAAERAQQQAVRARDEMVEARRTAQAQAAAQYALDLWNDAEGRSSEAQAVLARGTHAEAGPAFDAAAAAYRRSEEAARAAQVRELEAAEQAREQMALGQQSAQEAGAEQYARKLWDAADVKSSEAQAAFGKKGLGRGVGLFNEAAALYRRADEAASEARQRELRGAEEARDRVAQGQRAAAAVDAEHHAPALWKAAAAKSAGAQSDLAREQYAKAAEAFDEALVLYRQAVNQVEKTRGRQRDQANEGRRAISERRSSAAAADAPLHAPSEWTEAEAIVASSDAAFAREAYAEASRGFDRAVALYRLAEERARDAVHVLETARLEAVKAVEATAVTRQALEQTILRGEATAIVPSMPADAPTRLAEPPTVLVEAPTVLTAATTAIPSSTSAVGATGATRAWTREVSQPATRSGWRFWRLTMGAVGGLAVVALGVLFWLPRPAPPVSSPAPGVIVAPPGSLPAPPTIPAPAVPRVESPAVGDAATGADTVALHKREVEEAGQARVAAAKARQEAERAAAPTRAPRAFASAQQKESEAEAALAGQDAASARLQFQRAQQGYKQATQEAERAATGEEKQRTAAQQRQQPDADQARDRMAAARRTAEQAGSSQQATSPEAKQESEAQQQVAVLIREEAVRIEANRLAKDVFDAAQAKQAEAERLVSRRNYAAASLAFQDATARYMEATRRTQGVRDKSQAESARTRMLAEKQRADPAASDFASGLADERQGNGLYERMAYREATERFKSAETFFTRASSKPPPRSPAPPKP